MKTIVSENLITWEKLQNTELDILQKAIKTNRRFYAFIEFADGSIVGFLFSYSNRLENIIKLYTKYTEVKAIKILDLLSIPENVLDFVSSVKCHAIPENSNLFDVAKIKELQKNKWYSIGKANHVYYIYDYSGLADFVK